MHLPLLFPRGRQASYNAHTNFWRYQTRKEVKMENVDSLTTNLKECNEEVRIDVVESLISSLSVELAADPYTVCIFRVFEKYRKSKEEAYTPRVVSVGPLHHGKNHLQAMEACKLRYLKSFISKFNIKFEKLITYVAKVEASVRGCYENTCRFNSKEFSKMILLDGIFVVQLFVKNLTDQMREPGDMLFENQWMASDIMHDMLLLENQLPLNFILGLFEFVDSSRVHQKSFYELSLDYFKGVGNTARLKLVDGYERSRHLVEFLAILHRPHRLWETWQRNYRFVVHTRSASELHAAGVRFGARMGDLFDASFHVESGLLILPQLTVNDKTETFFRNLIAYEQCGHYDKYIASYIIFMDSFINTAEDVDLLVKHGIIKNLLGESKLVANLFNKLHMEVKEEQKDTYFDIILKDVNKYSESTWNLIWFKWKCRWLSWKSILMENYFNNPWSILSFSAATIVVVLTIVQTVWAIWGPKK